MTTSTVHTLARLGLVLTGTNEDLILPMPESKGGGEGESEDDASEETSEEEEGTGSGDGEESEETSEEEDAQGSGDGEESEEADEETDGTGAGSDEDTEEGEEGEEDSPKADGAEGEREEDAEGEAGDTGAEDDDSEPQGDAGDDEGDSEGEDTSGGDPEPGEGSDGEYDEDNGSEDGEESHDPSKDHSDGAGGMDDGMDPEEAQTLAQDLIDAIHDGDDETGLLDNNEALGEALDAKAEEEEEDCEENEQVWRPYDPSKDIVQVVQNGSVTSARRIKNKVKKEISYLRTKLRNKFLQARAPRTVHGVRKGRDLSERRLVSSVVELRSGRRPTRPDWDRHQRDDVTLAAAVVLDQSSSMGVKLAAKAAAAALAIATPLDELGSPCLVVGPRSGGGYGTGGQDLDPHGTHKVNGRRRFHRESGITIDIFKDWEEPMHRCLPRFSQVQSVGYTPLSDGIQYAMQHINERPERHRVILVVTDGQPDCPDVVRRQIRLAAEAGVHVVGVGISSGCWAVTRLFPTHVAVNNLNELPREMVKVLTAIVFPKKGKRIALDGKF